MHWCMDETLAFLAMIPIIGYFFRKLHAWWHAKTHHKCHTDGCDSDHVVHTNNQNDNVLTKGDVLIITGWDSIHPDDVKERFDDCIMDDLITDDYLLDVDEEPAADEFRWFVNDKLHLRAVFRERVFAHDDECCEHGWREISSDCCSSEEKCD